MCNILSELQIADQLAVDPPGSHIANREGAEGAQLDAPGRSPLSGRLIQCETIDPISVPIPVVHTQVALLVRIDEVEMRHVIPGTEAFEDRRGELEKRVPIFFTPGSLQVSIFFHKVHEAGKEHGLLVHVRFVELLYALDGLQELFFDVVSFEPIVEEDGRPQNQHKGHGDRNEEGDADPFRRSFHRM